MAAKAWKSLARKVLKFNEKFNGSGVICFALINNRFVYEGSPQIKQVFAENDDVQELYKAAILSHPSGNEPAEETTIEPTSSSLLDLLKKHVYDMDICMMRFILASAVAPQNSVGAKDGRRHWYQEANSPQWWRDTGIPFQSVNQPSGGNKKMKKVPLMTLVEALQGHHNVVPLPPQKNNKTGYASRFLVEADGNTEEPGNVSLSGTDTEGNLEDIGFPVAEEPNSITISFY